MWAIIGDFLLLLEFIWGIRTRSELRGASCEDWKSAFRQVKSSGVRQVKKISRGTLGRIVAQWVK
jgi:hypothetical protein